MVVQSQHALEKDEHASGPRQFRAYNRRAPDLFAPASGVYSLQSSYLEVPLRSRNTLAVRA